MLLNAAAILAAQDKRTVTVPCPEWGAPGTPQSDPASPDVAAVLVGSMGALDRARLGDWLLGQKPLGPGDDDEAEGDEGLTVVTCDSPGGRAEPVAEDESGDVAQVADDGPRYTKEQDTEFMVLYIAASILDPDTHRPAFTAQEIEALGAKARAPLERIYAAALALNGDTKAAAAELEKNSAGTPAGGSG